MADIDATTKDQLEMILKMVGWCILHSKVLVCKEGAVE